MASPTPSFLPPPGGARSLHRSRITATKDTSFTVCTGHQIICTHTTTSPAFFSMVLLSSGHHLTFPVSQITTEGLAVHTRQPTPTPNFQRASDRPLPHATASTHAESQPKKSTPPKNTRQSAQPLAISMEDRRSPQVCSSTYSSPYNQPSAVGAWEAPSDAHPTKHTPRQDRNVSQWPPINCPPPARNRAFVTARSTFHPDRRNEPPASDCLLLV